MIQKVIKKRVLNDPSAIKEDLTFWLKKPPEERVAAVDYLRKIHNGDTPRLQRFARVIQQTQR